MCLGRTYRTGHLALIRVCHKSHVGKLECLHNGLQFESVGWLAPEGIGPVGSEAVVGSR
jgi:hypothetical protein